MNFVTVEKMPYSRPVIVAFLWQWPRQAGASANPEVFGDHVFGLIEEPCNRI